MLLIAGPLRAAAPTAGPVEKSTDIPQRILFVGNSFTYFNNSLHSHLGSLLRADGRYIAGKTRLRAMTISGSTLLEHAGGMLSMVQDGQWDRVILQGHSTAFSSKKKSRVFRETARKFARHIRKQGAEPVFFMTWAYQNKPEMIKAIRAGYIDVANDRNALLVPVGLAFAEVNKNFPDINLYTADILKFRTGKDSNTGEIIYKKDIKHPSVAGSYLAACVFYAALFHQSPVGSVYTAGLEREQASILQRVAAQTVQEFDQ